MFQKALLVCFIALITLIIGSFANVGCSSLTAQERIEERRSSANPRGAAYAADGFTLDHRSPEPLPYEKFEFFYKHCTLQGRNPFPNRSEWSCTDPY